MILEGRITDLVSTGPGRLIITLATDHPNYFGKPCYTIAHDALAGTLAGTLQVGDKVRLDGTVSRIESSDSFYVEFFRITRLPEGENPLGHTIEVVEAATKVAT